MGWCTTDTSKYIANFLLVSFCRLTQLLAHFTYRFHSNSLGSKLRFFKIVEIEETEAWGPGEMINWSSNVIGGRYFRSLVTVILGHFMNSGKFYVQLDLLTPVVVCRWMIEFITCHRWLRLNIKTKYFSPFTLLCMVPLNTFPAMFGAQAYIFNSSS